MSETAIKKALIAAALSIVIVLGAFWLSAGLNSYEGSLQAATKDAQNLSHLLSKQAEDRFKTLDFFIQDIDRALQIADLADTGSHSQISDLMRSRIAYANYIRAFFIIGADGYIFHDTDHTTPHVSLKDREYFRFHEGAADSGLYIGKPLISRSVGTWFISASRRITTADGNFAGVIVAALELKNIENYFSQLSIGPHDFVSLWNNDGTLLVSWPTSEKWIGKVHSEVAPGLRPAELTFTSVFDEREKITTFDQLDNYPLFVMTEIDRNEVLLDWLKSSYILIIFFIVVVSLICLFVYYFLIYSKKLQENNFYLERLNTSLSKAENRNKQAQKIAHIGNFEYQVAGDVFWLSEEAKRLLGLDPEKETYPLEALSKRFLGRDSFNAIFLNPAGHREASLNVELKVKQHPGNLVVNIVAESHKDEAGEITVISGVIHDITERCALQEANERSSRLAAIGTLAAGVAHEINNPNSVIMHNIPAIRKVWNDLCRLLDEQPQNNDNLTLGGVPFVELRDEMPQMLQDCSDSSQRIKRIVNDLKDFSKDERNASNTEDAMEEIDLNDLADTASRLVMNRIKTATDKFSLELSSDKPKAMGDFLRLEQVVINLLINACDALTSPTQKICLVTRFDQERMLNWIEVNDQGGGISVEQQQRIFEPFYTTRRESGGTGLGLSISDTIIKEHGGYIDIVSQVGKGTCVKVALPVPP